VSVVKSQVQLEQPPGMALDVFEDPSRFRKCILETSLDEQDFHVADVGGGLNNVDQGFALARGLAFKPGDITIKSFA
jgi:hypothetical protein